MIAGTSARAPQRHPFGGWLTAGSADYFRRVTADLGQPSLAVALHVSTLGRTVLDLARTMLHDEDLRGAAQGLVPDRGSGLELANSLLLLAGLVAAPAPERALVLHEESWEITHHGRTLALTIAQYRLLRELVVSAEHTVGARHLATTMFGTGHREHDRVAAHVKRLRRRLVDVGVDDARIDTVRGVGYRLTYDS